MSEFSEDDADLLSAKPAAVSAPAPQPVPAAATEEKPAQLPAAPQTAPLPAVAKPEPMQSSEAVQLIVPRTYEEAYRLATGLVRAGMVPESLQFWTDSSGRLVPPWEARKNPNAFLDVEKTIARVSMVIVKGTELGLGAMSAIGTIMIVNNKPSIYGDGAKALVQRSGLIEYEKDEIKGERWGEGYACTVTLKRRNQSEPISRTFSYADAQRAKLLGKAGPWIDYPERQCYWRAWTWAARDVASDALYGLSVYEEQIDLVEPNRRIDRTADIKSLD